MAVTRTVTRSVDCEDACRQCGASLGEDDRVYGLEDGAFCSERCARRCEAKRLGDLRDRESLEEDG